MTCNSGLLLRSIISILGAGLDFGGLDFGSEGVDITDRNEDVKLPEE